MSSSTPPDQATMMKDILEALKSLQMNQVQLASNVDAISGRVNVLAGMKEIREVALPPAALSPPPKRAETNEEANHDEHSVPQSPSIPATALDGEGSSSQVSSHSRKTSTGTSRIILTWVCSLINLTSDADVSVVRIPASPVSILCLWTGATKTLSKEALLLFQEIQVPSVDEMVSTSGYCLKLNAHYVCSNWR